MGFEVGDKVVRKADHSTAFVHSVRSGRISMVEVRYENTGIRQWLPSEEFLACIEPPHPVEVKLTTWKRTTPEYLVNIRASQQLKDQRAAKKISGALQRDIEKTANELLGLSNKRKNRTRSKARKVIAKFERTWQTSPSNP